MLSVTGQKGFIMVYKVVGKKSYDFTSKEGNAVKGTKLCVLYEDSDWEGHRVDTLWVSDKVVMPDVKLPANLNVEFNRNGKVCGISVI